MSAPSQPGSHSMTQSPRTEPATAGGPDIPARSRIPDHVPPENVWDNDLVAFLGELGDPYLAGARLHDRPGVLWVTNASYGMPSWVFTQHALVHEGFAN